MAFALTDRKSAFSGASKTNATGNNSEILASVNAAVSNFLAGAKSTFCKSIVGGDEAQIAAISSWLSFSALIAIAVVISLSGNK